MIDMQIDNTVLYIEKDELLSLLKKAYEEGSYGYLDLKDSAANRILEDYLTSRKDAPPTTHPSGHFEPYPYGLQTNREGIQIASASGVIDGIQIGVSIPSIVSYDSTPSVVSFQYVGDQVTTV